MRYFLLLLFGIVNCAVALPIEKLKLPAGFKIEIFAQDLDSARQLALGEQGTVFVGTRDDKVYALSKQNGKVKKYILAKGLNHPNGVAFYKGSLYVAEINQVLRYDDIENKLNAPPKPTIIKKLPSESWHGLRYIAFGPDHKLYMGIGMPCNVCLPPQPQFGTIMRMNADGSEYEIYAKGIRNTVGFDWDPVTGSLWFTENGRDYLGDNLPPDKINVAPRPGMDFGFPYYNGKGLPDPIYGKNRAETDFTMPTFNLPAHVAPLGMKFYTGQVFPNLENSQAFVALHGSWNRSKKVGYQVLRIIVKGDQVINHEAFVSGWLEGERVWGRPVDILNMKDGSILISDDYANVIYRVWYQNKA